MFAIAHSPQLPAERLLGDGDAKLLEDPSCQIDQPPAYHAVDRRDWAALDHPDDRRALAIIELAGAPRRLSVQKTVGAPCVETQHPVPDDLETHAADLRRFEVEQNRASPVLSHHPELARQTTDQPFDRGRADRRNHHQNRLAGPMRTRHQCLCQGHQGH